MLLLLLCHLFRSCESCLPGSHLSQLCALAPGSSSQELRPHVPPSPPVLPPNPAAQGSIPRFWGHMGGFFGSSPWVPVSLSVPRVRHGPRDWFLSPPPSSTHLSPPFSLTAPLQHSLACVGTAAIQPSCPAWEASSGSLTPEFTPGTSHEVPENPCGEGSQGRRP